jgi:hypothetical protein
MFPKTDKVSDELASAMIPTGATVTKAIDIDASKSRGVLPATAPTMIGADIETGGATPKQDGSGCLTHGVQLSKRCAEDGKKLE